MVIDDDVNGVVSFNQRANLDGYMVDTSQPSTTRTTATAYLYGVIKHIMSMF